MNSSVILVRLKQNRPPRTNQVIFYSMFGSDTWLALLKEIVITKQNVFSYVLLCLYHIFFNKIPSHLRNILGMNAVYGVAHVLPRGHQEAEGEAGHDGDGVVQPEDARVDLDVGELHEALQPPQQVQHGELWRNSDTGTKFGDKCLDTRRTLKLFAINNMILWPTSEKGSLSEFFSRYLYKHGNLHFSSFDR